MKGYSTTYNIIFINPEILADTNIQIQLVKILAETDTSIKYEILWKFIGYGHANEQAVLNLLELFNEQKIGVGAYNLILRLVTLEHLQQNEQIASIIQNLSENENRYIRNLTTRLLENN